VTELIWPLLLAPFAGSLLGVLIRRMPDGRAVVLARSACEACGTRIAAQDLVPLVNQLWLRGRCRACGARIAPMHLSIELAALGVAAWAWLDAGAGDLGRLWAGCVLGWLLLALAWVDWEHWLLPDALTLPLLMAGLGATLMLQPDRIAAHAGGAALGYLGFRAVAALYRRWRGREGLGQGDAKLLAAAGAWLGWEALPMLVLIAALIGIPVAVVAGLRRGSVHGRTAIPFGLPLAAACWLLWLHGPALEALVG